MATLDGYEVLEAQQQTLSYDNGKQKAITRSAETFSNLKTPDRQIMRLTIQHVSEGLYNYLIRAFTSNPNRPIPYNGDLSVSLKLKSPPSFSVEYYDGAGVARGTLTIEGIIT